MKKNNIDGFLKAKEFSEYYLILEKLIKISEEREVVFLCVGNSRVWYDCFGPIFGSVLISLGINKYIYGNTKFNITANNVSYFVELIYKFHNNPYIIVVDSILDGNFCGGLKIREKSIICAGLSNSPLEIGDMSITYSIDINNKQKYYLLDDILQKIKKMSRILLNILT